MIIFKWHPLALVALLLAFVILAFIGAWGITTFTREWKKTREKWWKE